VRLKEGVSLREDVSLARHVQTGHEKKSCTLYRSSRCPSGGSLPVEGGLELSGVGVGVAGVARGGDIRVMPVMNGLARALS
jgi:hypothetical protein